MNPYVLAAAIAIGFGAGWTTKTWQANSVELVAKLAADAVVEAGNERESKIAIIVSNKLKGLKANERIIERHTKEIIDRPVYRVDCIDTDGLNIINGLFTIPSARSSSSSGIFIGEMSFDLSTSKWQNWQRLDSIQ